MTYQNFPRDITERDQWMVYKDGSKKPYDPETVSQSDWKDPLNWGSFLSAWSAVFYGRAAGLGFVNTPDTGLQFLDLDNKPSNPASEQQLAYHTNILEMTAGTYCEYSLSTTETHAGFHVIVKCGVPLHNINREHIEYRSHGFTALTGWTVTGEAMPVLNGIDNNLMQMHQFLTQANQAKPIALSEPENRSDDDLWSVLQNSNNNEKLFKPKQGGDSETDYDIACWITKLTRNKEQAIRLFLRTPYAWGKKSDGKVLAESNYHLSTLFDRALTETQVPAIDISKLVKPAQQLPSPVVTPRLIENPMAIAKMPEGWCKEFAKFTLANSMSPLEEAAVFASFLPVAGVGGRVFNASNTGLNQQFTLLALTGTGKDEAVNAAQKVFTKVTMAAPDTAIQAFIASDFSSAQAIHRALTDQPAMFGYNKEQGMWMERMSKPNPDDHMLAISSVMLDIYNLAGAYLKSRKYAKKENDLSSVYSPTLSTLSVSTPRQFYEYMSIKMLDTGITGRELIFECEDTEAKARPYSYLTPEPSRDIIDGMARLATLAQRNIREMVNGVATFGPFAIVPNPEADALMNHWRDEYIRIQNSDNGDIHRAIWSRANLKMRKLAGTFAVSHAMMYEWNGEMQMPIIAPEHVQYAVDVVNHCSSQLQMKLQQRGIGNLYVQQEELFEEAVEWYFSEEANLFTQFKNEDIKARMWKARADGVIFKSQIMPRVSSKAAFSGHNRSTAIELDRTLKNKIGSGLYVHIPTEELYRLYGVRSEAFGRVG